MNYYILINDETNGPFTLAEIESMWRDGTIRSDVWCSKPDATEWRTVGEVLASPDGDSISDSISDSKIADASAALGRRYSRRWPVFATITLALGSLAIGTYWMLVSKKSHLEKLRVHEATAPIVADNGQPSEAEMPRAVETILPLAAQTHNATRPRLRPENGQRFSRDALDFLNGAMSPYYSNRTFVKFPPRNPAALDRFTSSEDPFVADAARDELLANELHAKERALNQELSAKVPLIRRQMTDFAFKSAFSGNDGMDLSRARNATEDIYSVIQLVTTGLLEINCQGRILAGHFANTLRQLAESAGTEPSAPGEEFGVRMDPEVTKLGLVVFTNGSQTVMHHCLVIIHTTFDPAELMAQNDRDVLAAGILGIAVGFSDELLSKNSEAAELQAKIAGLEISTILYIPEIGTNVAIRAPTCEPVRFYRAAEITVSIWCDEFVTEDVAVKNLGQIQLATRQRDILRTSPRPVPASHRR